MKIHMFDGKSIIITNLKLPGWRRVYARTQIIYSETSIQQVSQRTKKIRTIEKLAKQNYIYRCTFLIT